MRRLPVFLLLDVSESMVGDNLRFLQQGMKQLVEQLRTDPHALESVHLSVIVFAGKARTLTPLIELAAFYPPRLPVGSGTSLGAALEHLMRELDQAVNRTTAERKGDFRPVVYLMTDGKPTDAVDAAIERWQRDYAQRVSLVGIGIGQYAALDTLRRLSPDVLHLQAQTEADFKRFIAWVTQSVAVQSRGVTAAGGGVSLAKPDDSIMRTVDAIVQGTVVDEDFVILCGRCQNTRLPYLIRYERSAQPFGNLEFRLAIEARYQLTGVFALEADYDELSDSRALVRTVNSGQLIGAPGCPHCGNPIAFAVCRCSQILCVRGAGEATCPACGEISTFVMRDEDDGGCEVGRVRG